jgi:hypothetical protein
MTSTEPTIPAWLNIDAIASPEERERIAEIAKSARQ